MLRSSKTHFFRCLQIKCHNGRSRTVLRTTYISVIVLCKLYFLFFFTYNYKIKRHLWYSCHTNITSNFNGLENNAGLKIDALTFTGSAKMFFWSIVEHEIFFLISIYFTDTHLSVVAMLRCHLFYGRVRREWPLLDLLQYLAKVRFKKHCPSMSTVFAFYS